MAFPVANFSSAKNLEHEVVALELCHALTILPGPGMNYSWGPHKISFMTLGTIFSRGIMVSS